MRIHWDGRTSTVGYFSDFAVYPLAIAAVWSVLAWSDAGRRLALLALLAVAGVLLWTLLEYLLHRFILHRLPVVRTLHALHHAEPVGLVGAPTMLSLPLIVGGVFVPAWSLLSPGAAAGLTTGVMLGYLAYGGVHYWLHHRSTRHLPPLRRLKRHHALHHHRDESCNFGVSTRFWDRVFGTLEV